MPSTQGAALGAHVARRDRVVGVAAHRDDLVAVDGHDEAAGRQADPAEAPLLSGHCDIMARVTDWIEQYFAAWAGTDPDAVVAFMTDDVEFEDVTAGHHNV